MQYFENFLKWERTWKGRFCLWRATQNEYFTVYDSAISCEPSSASPV